MKVCVCASENTTVKLTSLSHLLIFLIASLNYNVILKITFVFSLTSLFLKEKIHYLDVLSDSLIAKSLKLNF